MTEMEYCWNARTVEPVAILYVAGVFAGFMAMTHLIFHSPEAVKALFLTALGSVATLAAGVLTGVEYRLTENGLSKRPLKTKNPKAFKEIFAWDELSHVIPTSRGFKYFKHLPASGPLRRFLRQNLSDSWSGEFHVEKGDRPRVLEFIHQHRIPTSRPPALR